MFFFIFYFYFLIVKGNWIELYDEVNDDYFWVFEEKKNYLVAVQMCLNIGKRLLVLQERNKEFIEKELYKISGDQAGVSYWIEQMNIPKIESPSSPYFSIKTVANGIGHGITQNQIPFISYPFVCYEPKPYDNEIVIVLELTETRYSPTIHSTKTNTSFFTTTSYLNTEVITSSQPIYMTATSTQTWKSW